MCFVRKNYISGQVKFSMHKKQGILKSRVKPGMVLIGQKSAELTNSSTEVGRSHVIRGHWLRTAVARSFRPAVGSLQGLPLLTTSRGSAMLQMDSRKFRTDWSQSANSIDAYPQNCDMKSC